MGFPPKNGSRRWPMRSQLPQGRLATAPGRRFDGIKSCLFFGSIIIDSVIDPQMQIIDVCSSRNLDFHDLFYELNNSDCLLRWYMFESDLMIYYQYDIPKKVHWLWIPILYIYICPLSPCFFLRRHLKEGSIHWSPWPQITREDHIASIQLSIETIRFM